MITGHRVARLDRNLKIPTWVSLTFQAFSADVIARNIVDNQKETLSDETRQIIDANQLASWRNLSAQVALPPSCPPSLPLLSSSALVTLY